MPNFPKREFVIKKDKISKNKKDKYSKEKLVSFSKFDKNYAKFKNLTKIRPKFEHLTKIGQFLQIWPKFDKD